jgi:transposase
MTSMTRTTVGVTGGVDTHGQSHHAAVIDHLGRQLGDREFPASPAGYGALVEWLQGHGEVDRVGVEGTGTYGAGLARHLREAGILMVEVDRPDRRARRAHGKSDPLDAYSAARAALSGAASVVPKLRDGRVEAIRALRVARSSAVKARSQAMNQIKSLIVTGPAQLREQLRHLPTLKLIAACARLRPGHQLGDTEHATKTALRRLARRHQQLSEEIAEADQELHQLVHQVAPALLFPELDPKSPARCSSAPATTLTGSSPKPPSRTSAAPRRSPPAADAPTDTGSIAAVTVAPTMPSTLSFLADSDTTHAAAPTPSAALTKACQNPRSSAA